MKKITNYRVLARKYRPKIFSDLVGQDVLARTLSNSISGNRVYQAFILTGMRGVGKTTTARIIARSINCLNITKDDNDNLLPCNNCDQCKSIDSGNNVDVIEIDAASNTGVSNIREIIENVKYRPVSSNYKVYVIDDCSPDNQVDVINRCAKNDNRIVLISHKKNLGVSKSRNFGIISFIKGASLTIAFVMPVIRLTKGGIERAGLTKE